MSCFEKKLEVVEHCQVASILHNKHTAYISTLLPMRAKMCYFPALVLKRVRLMTGPAHDQGSEQYCRDFPVFLVIEIFFVV